MKIAQNISTYILVVFFLLQGYSCVNRNDSSAKLSALPDTLKVGTLYSPTSLFIFRGDTMGYEYERISNFANDKNIKVEFVLAKNMESMIAMLDSGKIDVIAYEIPITAEYKDIVLNCGTENITHQVLVQPKSDSLITDVTQLIGKDVWVEKNSKYESRLRNLDNEIGGGIEIHTISEDSLITEDLIDLVSDGKITYTIVDSDIAKLNNTYYDNIDISMSVSFPQRSSWAVRLSDKWLADSINEWSRLAKSKDEYKNVLKRYFELSKRSIDDSASEYFLPSDSKRHNNVISPFDHIFKEYAAKIDWDWKLLASQAWIESRFDTTVVSWAGAKGLMQIMPGTARAYGLRYNEATNAAKNVKAAVACISDLNAYFEKRISNKKERLKFIIAAYNSGLGHIVDAMALAKKYGKNPIIWYGNVEEAILWKSNPDFYNDEVCKYGYFRGRQTVAYVKKVLHQYELFKKIN